MEKDGELNYQKIIINFIIFLSLNYNRIMKSDLKSKVTTLLTGCDTECQRIKELNKLKVQYTDYLQKYIKAYSEYQILQYGKTLEEKKFQQEYEKISREFNNKMKYIESILKSDIEEADKIIDEQKKIIKEKNIILGKNKIQIEKRKKILNTLTKNLVTDKGQIANFDDQLLNKIAIIPYGIFNRIVVNYDRSTFYLFLIILIIFTIIVILIFKIIV